ncbi:host specificity factor TipJ family phage tail protein [Utexia brackfieldae]|uniref:host specificity factor TipJ family phage tail protein n=1 Tax=Utexia brackfieldae TaxID=3074108 RepID=UPI00370DC303
MLIYQNDPKGLFESKRFVFDTDKTLQQNIELYFPAGLNAKVHDIVINGVKVNPLKDDLNIRVSHDDNVVIIRRQQGVELLVGLVVAVVAAVVAYALTPKPKIPNSSGEQKDSSNNKLTGQTNIARAYQAKPDIFGLVRVYPDLVKPSGSEYINNVKYIDHLMCVGIGEYVVSKPKYSETLLDKITGTDYQIYNPGDIIPQVMYQYASDEVNGQELTPPNLSNEAAQSVHYENYESIAINNGIATIVLPQGADTGYLQGLMLPAGLTFSVTSRVTYILDGEITTIKTFANYNGNLQSVKANENDQPMLIVSSVIFTGFDDKVGNVSDIEYLNDEIIVTRNKGGYTDAFILPEEGTEIWVDLVFQRGLQGAVSLSFAYWQIDELGNEVINTRDVYTYSVSMNTYEPQNVTIKIKPKRGQSKYAIIAGRTNDGKTDLTDQVKIENIYSVSYESNVKVNDTLIYVRTKATSQATSLKELKINAEVMRKTISYNLEACELIESLTPSRSFADAVLHSYAVIAGRDPNDLDLQALYSIDQAIKKKDPRLGYFDFSFDDADVSLGERIQAICNAARVFTYKDGQKWRFVRDEKKTRPVALFNSSNLANTSEGGTIQYKCNLPTSYDGIELEYVNSSHDNKGGTDKKAFVRLKIDSVKNVIAIGESRQPYKIQLTGCRNYTQAMNRAQLEVRKLLYQRVTVEDEALCDASFVNKGDLVRWCDTWDSAVVNGEITSFERNRFFINQQLELDPSKKYRVSITDRAGYPSEWLDVLGHDSVSFTANFNDVYTADYIKSQMGSIFIITETKTGEAVDFILSEKQYKDGNYQIKLINYDERMYQYDNR